MRDETPHRLPALEVEPPLDDLTAEALALVLGREGLADPRPQGHGGAWWRAGVEQAVGRAPEPAQALSPRSTRGATRA